MMFCNLVQNLEATGKLSDFGGEFQVPMYRGSSFLDPKVCCLTKSTATPPQCSPSYWPVLHAQQS
jgi:hypothetical protein